MCFQKINFAFLNVNLEIICRKFIKIIHLYYKLEYCRGRICNEMVVFAMKQHNLVIFIGLFLFEKKVHQQVYFIFFVFYILLQTYR